MSFLPRITTQWFSPTKVLFTTWILAIGAAHFAPKGPLRTGHAPAVFTLTGLLWIAVCLGLFWAGCHIANSYKAIFLYSGQRLFDSRREKIAEVAYNTWMSMIIGLIIALSFVFLLIIWTWLAVLELGGPADFLHSAYQNWHHTREVWINQKPFTGARLLYSGLIAVGIYAASVSGVKSVWEEHDFGLFKYTLLLLAVSMIPLFLIPILISQRILFLTALSAALVAYLFSRDQGINALLIVAGVCIGFTLWTTQELVRAGFSTPGLVSSLTYSLDRFLLYFANDIGNLNRAVKFVTNQTYGFFTFHFVFRFLFIEDLAREVLLTPEYLAEADRARSAGTWTAFGIPYVDFGIFGGVLLFVWGFISQKAFNAAKSDTFAAQVYGLIVASIILSWHFALWSIPEFWFNIFLLGVLNLPSVRKKLHLTKAKG